MTPDDVLEVLDWLAAAGVRMWVDGGWGVDALLGEQTREHADLDLAVPVDDEPEFSNAAAAHGFEVVPDRVEWQNWVLEDARGRQVDVHFVDLDDRQRGEDGRTFYGPKGLAYDVGAFGATGVIGGRDVPCCTAELQVRSHDAYAGDATDLHDVLLLCERFGIPLPEQYRRMLDVADPHP